MSSVVCVTLCLSSCLCVSRGVFCTSFFLCLSVYCLEFLHFVHGEFLDTFPQPIGSRLIISCCLSVGLSLCVCLIMCLRVVCRVCAFHTSWSAGHFSAAHRAMSSSAHSFVDSVENSFTDHQQGNYHHRPPSLLFAYCLFLWYFCTVSTVWPLTTENLDFLEKKNLGG